MILTEFNQIAKKYFDMSDRPTRQYLISLDEDGNEKVLAALTAKLYKNIVEKVGEIDFGTIPRSRGDITKVEKFNMTEESLDIIRKLVLEYKENTKQVDTIITSIENVKDNKSLFMKGYALNVELPMLLYNTLVLAIVRSTSLIIATCIKYIADPSTKSMKMAFDKAAYKDTEADVMFQQLVSFNELFKDGSLVKMIDSVIRNGSKRGVNEDIELSDLNTVPNGMDSEFVPRDDSNTGDEEKENIISFTIPNNIEAPALAAYPQNQLPKSEEGLPNDEDVLAGNSDIDPNSSDTTIPANPVNPNPSAIIVVKTDDNIPAPAPIMNPSVQPIIPENRDPESFNSNVESCIDDEESDELRKGKEKYDSEYKEAIKQKIIGKANENAIQKEYIKNKILEANLATLAVDAVKNAWNKADPVAKAGMAASGILLAVSTVKLGFHLLINVVIPSLRNMIYTFYYAKMKISDYFQIQAELLEANALELENTSSDNEDAKKKIIQKQRKWADRFRKWANMFNIDKTTSEKQSKEEMKKEDKEKSKIGKNDSGDDVLF